MSTLVCLAIGYVTGSIPLGLLVGWLAGGIDIRAYGTRNIGASNMFRNLGLGPASLVGLGTFLQGFGPALAAGWVTGSTLNTAAAGVGSVAGYGWSIFLRLQGGRAVGTTTGALAAFSPWGLIPLLGCYALGGLVRLPGPFVLLGLLVYLVYMVALPHPLPLVLGTAAVVGVVVVKRLAGVRQDLRQNAGQAAAVIFDRLINDRRPGQRLHGPAAH
jgi:acyl-phosphate glycerol 3-phosphate acyltransferase